MNLFLSSNFRSSRRQIPTFITGILFLVVSGFIALFFVSFANKANHVDYELINEKGADLNAIITDYKIISNTKINGKHPIEIFYKYDFQNKLKTDSFQTLSLKKIKDWHIGDAINIKYFNGATIIKNISPLTFPILLFLFPLLFFVIGLALTFFGLRKIIQKYRLLKYGEPKKATFSHFETSGNEITIYYYYTTSYGKIINGDSKTKNLSLLEGMVKGDTIDILYLPNNEKISCILELKTC
jgi:hypothetical protein